MANGNGRALTTPQAVNAAIISICDILRRSNVAGALQYIPEITWLLFLRILDEREAEELKAYEAVGRGTEFVPSLTYPYRWQDWAAPSADHRQQLWNAGSGALFNFVNNQLLPHLRGLRDQSDASPRQKVISEILSSVKSVRVDTERNLLDVLDRAHEISEANIDKQHVFPLSQAYEGLLLLMGEKNNDGGQFFTPREVIRAVVQVVNPQVNETVYDPCCGTGGFLAQSYEQIFQQWGDQLNAEQLDQLKQATFYGREKDDVIYPIALANLVLHGIDEPHIWHGNTLTGTVTYAGLYHDAPELFDIVMTNPPFGGKEGKEAQTNFAYKTSATQVLFLQHVIDSLRSGGRCGMVLDEGVLFRTNEDAFVKTKRKLLDECNVWSIVSLPAGTFLGAGGGVKTNLLFFTKGQPTERIWYYDLSDVKVTKRKPLTIDSFNEFFELLPARADSAYSWTVTREELDDRSRKEDAKGEVIFAYDLKAVNPNAITKQDTRTPEELLDLIEAKGREVAEALEKLRRLG